MILLRDVRLSEQQMPRAKRSLMSRDLAGHEERLKAHEERIHNHPCGCGTADACGRDFRRVRGLTCPWCGYNNGAGPAPRTGASVRAREWWRKQRDEEDQALQELLDLRRDD